MRTFRLTAVAAVAALALSTPIFAAQAKPAVKAAKAETIRGTLEKVNGQDITVKTAKGEEEVMLGADSKIRRDGKTLAATDLGTATGSQVTVRYKEDNGHKMAESVTLAAAKAAPKQVASAKSAASTKGTKK